MSQVIFNNRINMILAATPSIGGYTVGYDLDGVIKQKDSIGIVTPLFTSSSENLAQTLQLGNTTGAYSIIMGTATYITSANAKSSISLDTNGGVFIHSTASGTSSISLGSTGAIIRNVSSVGNSQISILGSSVAVAASSATQSLSLSYDENSISISHSDTHAGISSVSVLQIGSSYDNDTIDNKSYVHINSKNANTEIGVKNSVIIGGSGLTASSSNTVYLGNSVNINNEFTLPNTDGNSGQILMTDGAGSVSWSDISAAAAPPLSQVLAAGENSESYSIVMGTGTSIASANGQSSISLDFSSTQNRILISTDGSSMEKSYVQLNGSALSIGATSGTITIGDNKGLVYAADYSATFVNNSLVTKQYVDAIVNSVFLTYKIAYVDSFNGDDTTGIVNRVDKPYLTVEKATAGLTNSYVFTSTDKGLIHIKKGTYTESVMMFDNINYYCEPGVVFTGNGFTDLNAAVNCSIMGHADFISNASTNLVPLDITRASNVNFEFRNIDNLSVAFKVTNTTGTSNIKIKGDYVKTQSRLGRGILIGNQAGSSVVSSNISMQIRESILGAYDVIDVRPLFAGSLDIKCPSIYCDADINTLTGAQIDAQHALVVRSASASVNLEGDIYETTSNFSGGNNAAVYATSCNVMIKGNIDAGNCPGVVLEGTYGTFSVSGSIKSKRESLINSTNGVSLRISDSLIRTDGAGAVPYALNINSGTMSSTYIHNSRIYNSVQNSGIIIMSKTHSVFGIYNSIAYSPGTASGNFIYSAGTVSVGIHNTRCNKDNSELVEDIFAPSGFIYDDRFYMEGF
jgi:hypothetical protein